MVELFMALQTQWRVASGFAVQYLGIDYPAAEVLMRVRRMNDRVQAFGDLAVMEHAALAVLNVTEAAADV